MPPRELSLFSFLVSWFFAIVQELLGCVALVWSQTCVFSSWYLVVVCDPVSPWFGALVLGVALFFCSVVGWCGVVAVVFRGVCGCVVDWVFYQRLLALLVSILFGGLGFDVEFWLVCFVDVVACGPTFERSVTLRACGRLVLFFAWVEALVALQSASWLGLALSAFGVLFGTGVRGLLRKVLKMRPVVDEDGLASGSASGVVWLLTCVEAVRPSLLVWVQQVAVSCLALLLLGLARFQFPVEWLQVALFGCFWWAFSSVVKLLDSVVRALVAVVLVWLVSEDQAVYARTVFFLLVWGILPAGCGRSRVAAGFPVLHLFAAFFSRLQEVREVFALVSEAVALEVSGFPVWLGGLLCVVVYVLAALRCVWRALWWFLGELAVTVAMPWLWLDGFDFLQSLGFVVSGLKLLGARFRMYELLVSLTMLLELSLTVLMLMVVVASAALGARLWLPVSLQLRVGWVLFAVALGVVCGVDLLSFYSLVVAVLVLAAGEMALEEFLKQVRESWQNYELDLINYQNKCRIIRGWDDLFCWVSGYI
uniref:Putative dynein heavy chain n=1 Tax=Anopheles darlingi TaxID=43151 RepID=A0A2M4DS29_ANODA